MLRAFFCLLLVIPSLSYAKECTRLTVSSNPEYPPYLWQTNTQPIQLAGLLVSFSERISKVSGIDIDVVYAGPWLRTQYQIHDGNIDLIAVFYTEDRTSWLDYLHPELIKTDTAVWVNKSKKFDFKTWEDLKGYSGLTVLGHSLGQEFDDYATEHLTLNKVSSIHQALKMLEEKRVDYLVYARAPGEAYALQLGTQDVVTLPMPVSTELVYLALSKNSKCNTPRVREKLNAALRQAVDENWPEALTVEAQNEWKTRQEMLKNR